ncbi:hypothetical protein GBF38_021958, partial [Nibea albiflora]
GDAFRGYKQEQNQDAALFGASGGCNPFCSIEISAVDEDQEDCNQ